MATGQDTYDYTTDPQFIGAPPDVQHAYLSANNPNYAKADPELQKAYISHLNKDPHGERAAAINPPIAGVTKATPASSERPGNPLATKIGMEEAVEPSNKAIGEGVNVVGTMAPAMVSPVTTAGAIAGGMVGAPVGSSALRRTVGALGGGKEAQDTAGTIGGWGGGLAGSFLGGSGANAIELPEEATIGGVKIKTPSWMRPKLPGVAPTEPSSAEFESQREAQLTKEGKLAKIPVRMPKPKAPPEEFPAPPVPVRAHGEMESDLAKRAAQTPEAVAKRGLAVGEAKSSLVHGRPFEQLNEQEQAEALMRRGNQQRQIDEGLPVEGSSQKPLVVPEARKPGPADRPGSQWSVKRRSELPNNAKRAQPGASDVLQNLRPVVLEPRGVVGANTRTPEAESAIRGAGTIGTPPKGPNGLKLTTDSLGVRWASSPDSPNPVSIPKSVPENQVGDYATTKLAEQAEMAKGIKSNVESANVTVDDLADAIQKKTGNDPAKAMDMAKHYKAAAEGAPNYNGEERRHAAEWIGRYMGPERRKP